MNQQINYRNAEGLTSQEYKFLSKYLRFLDYVKMGFGFEQSIAKSNFEIDDYEQYQYLIPQFGVES